MRLLTVDVSESEIAKDSKSLLQILLKDRTTKRNIVWASPSYKGWGKDFTENQAIKLKSIIGPYESIIQPRVAKRKTDQAMRTRKRGEVFTPSWLVDKQVRQVEDELGELIFEKYICLRWIEIACGEGPYIVTRYDSVTGDIIPVENRVGFLDRKLQRILQETKTEKEFIKWARIAYQSTYGYELQGDSLLLARENLLLTFYEYYAYAFERKPELKTVNQIANIISYNLFQMNGLTLQIPYSSEKKGIQLDLFNDEGDQTEQNDKVAQIKDWKDNELIAIDSIAKGECEMKFDVVIGNPPYQIDGKGERARKEPIYHFFIDSARELGNRSILITPGRFLFNAGQTPKRWNERILHDKHTKVLYYEINANKVFSNVGFKGGIAITYYDSIKEYPAIGTFTIFNELNNILHKVVKDDFKSFNAILFGKSTYRFKKDLYDIYPELKGRVSKGEERSISSNIFEKLPELFSNVRDNVHNLGILGRENDQRAMKWITSEVIEDHPNLYKYKVLVPASNGSGVLGEVLSTPLIGEPLIGYTQTFISFGAFNSEEEAKATLKYIKTKFLRTLLGTMKITQHNQSKEVWKNVPLQDFTPNSDIDWSQSIPEIDKQLYAKYDLSQEEINFIEEKVKAMD